MGSRSRSSTTQETTNVQDIDTTTISLEDIDGLGFANIGGDVAVQVSDSGAIAAGENIALSGLDFGGDVVERAFDFGEGVFGGALKAVTGATQTAIASTRSEASQSVDKFIKFGSIVAGLFALGFVIQRARA